MIWIAVAVLWLLVGAAVGIVEARHGGWHRTWAVFALYGPFAVPLALERRRHGRPAPAVLVQGRAGRGPVDLLIGVDGSPASMTAASFAVRLLGPQVRRVTLATVLDVDTAAPHADDVMYPDPWPEEQAARAHLETAASALERELGVAPGSVVLAGEPADALERYAIDEGYEVIVVGSRGKGLSKLLVGSCASGLASRTKVPVLLIPAHPATTAGPRTRSAAASAGE